MQCRSVDFSFDHGFISRLLIACTGSDHTFDSLDFFTIDAAHHISGGQPVAIDGAISFFIDIPNLNLFISKAIHVVHGLANISDHYVSPTCNHTNSPIDSHLTYSTVFGSSNVDLIFGI